MNVVRWQRMMMTSVLAMLGLAFLNATPQAAEPKRGPTPLGKLAASMKPGTWAELPTEGLTNQILKAPTAKGLDIMGWSDDGHWDGKTGQFLFMGLRGRRRFVAYTEATNAWRNIPLAEKHEEAGSPPIDSQYGHIYARNAHDPERSRYYHMDHNGGGIYRYDLAKDQWTKLPPGGSYSMTGVIEYFSARKGLVNLGVAQEVRFFDEDKQTWEKLGPCAVQGHHSLGRHNPMREEVLLAGGNESPRAVVRLTKDGKLERLKDAPEDLTVRFGKITVDPVSGRYLILYSDLKKLYEFDSGQNEYRLVDDFTQTPWPFGRYDMPVAAFIPEHGVTMWAANKVMLYKHDAGK